MIFSDPAFRSEAAGVSKSENFAGNFPRTAEHMSGHGGNFHLHGGHLEHVIGDEDGTPSVAAGMASDYQRYIFMIYRAYLNYICTLSLSFRTEAADQHKSESYGGNSPRAAEHMSGHGGNFHLYGGHLEHVIGDEDGKPSVATGMNRAELDHQWYT